MVLTGPSFYVKSKIRASNLLTNIWQKIEHVELKNGSTQFLRTI